MVGPGTLRAGASAAVCHRAVSSKWDVGTLWRRWNCGNVIMVSPRVCSLLARAHFTPMGGGWPARMQVHVPRSSLPDENAFGVENGWDGTRL